MTKSEFSRVMAWISLAIGKPIVEGAGEAAERERLARTEVYYEMLGDLPFEVLNIAARRVVASHPWNTFPSIAELRQAAAETLQGRVAQMSGGEAWQIAWKAASKIDPEVEGSCERHTKDLPPLVIEAMKNFGLVALTRADPNFARPQFLKIWDALTTRENRHALLPMGVKKAIAAISEASQPKAIGPIAKQIGVIEE